MCNNHTEIALVATSHDYILGTHMNKHTLLNGRRGTKNKLVVFVYLFVMGCVMFTHTLDFVKLLCKTVEHQSCSTFFLDLTLLFLFVTHKPSVALRSQQYHISTTFKWTITLCLVDSKWYMWYLVTNVSRNISLHFWK